MSTVGTLPMTALTPMEPTVVTTKKSSQIRLLTLVTTAADECVRVTSTKPVLTDTTKWLLLISSERLYILFYTGRGVTWTKT